MSLNQKVVARLDRPESGNKILYDGEVPGFGVRTTSAGVSSYVLDYRSNGRKRRITIGRASEFSVVAAREEAIRLRSEIRNGADPLAQRERSRLLNPTMKDLAVRYMADYAERFKRPASIRNDRGMLEGIITPKVGNLPVASVTRQDIENLHRSLKGTPYRANRVLSLLGKAFALAIQWSWRPDNPVRGVRRFEEDQNTRWLDRQEIKRLLSALDRCPDPDAANAIRLLLYTGARKGEVLAARWEDLNFKAGRWTKPKTNTKQKRQEVIPLAGVALTLLRKMHLAAREPRNGWVFPGRKKDSHLENIKQHWPAIRVAAGLGDDVRVHSLRHTFASHLVSQGESLETVGALLGHTQIQTTMRYSHLSDLALRNAANSFGDIVKKGRR